MEAYLLDLSKNLGVRSVNSVRGTHVGTYIALRVFLDQFPIDSEDVLLNDFVTCSKISHPQIADLYTNNFKKETDLGRIEYRRMRFPCPTRVVADTLALANLPRISNFRRSKCSFSYELARSPESKFSYEPYWIGYTERRDKISDMLRGQDDVLLSLDFKSFYHRLRPSDVAQVLRAHFLHSSLLSRTERWAQDYVVGVLDSTSDDKGLPVGPELSHYLADMYLEKFDNLAVKEFGDRILRYVDDVAVVVPRNKLEATRSFLASLSEDAGGMKLNDEKTLTYDSATWELAQSYRKRRPEELSYGELVYGIRVFVLLGGNVDELDRAMEDAGLRLPVRRLAERTLDDEYRTRVQQHLLESRDFAVRASTSTVKDLVAKAIAAGKKLREQVEDLARDPAWERSEVRPYLEKYLRTLSTHSLMLADSQDLRFVSEVCNEKGCSSEFRACVEAVLDSKIDRVLRMPGRAQHALVELLGTHSVNLLIDGVSEDSLIGTEEDRLAMISSLCEFAASGCTGRGLLRFAGKDNVDEQNRLNAFTRTFDRRSLRFDDSYIDEVGSLLYELSEDDHRQLLTNTRYPGEIKPIFTTKLDGHYYS